LSFSKDRELLLFEVLPDHFLAKFKFSSKFELFINFLRDFKFILGHLFKQKRIFNFHIQDFLFDFFTYVLFYFFVSWLLIAFEVYIVEYDCKLP